MSNFRNTGVLVSVMFIVLGCSKNNPTYRFDNQPHAEKKSNISSELGGKGAVIFSASIAKGYHKRENYCMTRDSAFDVFFVNYQKSTKTTIKDAKHFSYARAHFALLGHSEKLYQPLHRVFVIPPGHYVMKQINWKFGNGVFQTPLIPDKKSGARSAKYTAGNYPDAGPIGDAPRFHVRSGEIVYLGNWVLCPGVPPGQLLVTRHDGMAQNAIAAYPNISGPIVFRELGNKD